ncbi:isochorismatase family cysteine hydrolase [Kitasatospora sp. NPDC086791]|uniref:isochorismatase family cysteine hydrolase n=1 Tax=Kitasatospora sp. NPDC086791 TaxID=3155178 RepID=UPI00341F6DDD
MSRWEAPSPASAVLVVVDVQVGFANASSNHVVPVITELLAAWQAAGRDSVVATFTNPPGSPYETISNWTKLRTDAEQALVPELIPLAQSATARFSKSTSDLFQVDDALAAFRTHGWTDIVICGIDTDSCVHDTAVGAYHRSITPWLVTDACASSGGPEYHDIALKLAARNLGGRLVSSTDVHHWLRKDGTH